MTDDEDDPDKLSSSRDIGARIINFVKCSLIWPELVVAYSQPYFYFISFHPLPTHTCNYPLTYNVKNAQENPQDCSQTVRERRRGLILTF